MLGTAPDCSGAAFAGCASTLLGASIGAMLDSCISGGKACTTVRRLTE